jgi:hypothetical protein
VDPESVQNEDRERAKRVVYSVVYGVGKLNSLIAIPNILADLTNCFWSRERTTGRHFKCERRSSQVIYHQFFG